MTGIAFLRRGFFAVQPYAHPNTNLTMATTIAIELLNLGYIVDPKDLTALSVAELNELVQQAAVLVGAPRSWKPLYENFPQEVIETSDVDLFINAIVHYLTAGEWRPEARRVFRRYKLLKSRKPENPRVLKPLIVRPELLIAEWEKALAFSTANQEFVVELACYFRPQLLSLLAETNFRNGENFATALTTVHMYASEKFSDVDMLEIGIGHSRNVDDVLRAILVAFAKDNKRAVDLKCSQQYPVNFRRIPRRARVAILAALTQYSQQYNLDLLVRRRALWQRVMQRVHPFDVQGHRKAQYQLDIIHDNNDYQTVNAKVQHALSQGDIRETIDILSDNPGNFIRRINHLMRIATHYCEDNSQCWFDLLEGITTLGPRVRLSTLISAYNAVSNYDAPLVLTRLGRNGNHLRQRTVQSVAPHRIAEIKNRLRAAMIERLRHAPKPDTAVPTASQLPVELILRDTSSGIATYSRGQRISLPQVTDHDTVRLFVHWYGNDVDLGVAFTDERFEKLLAFVDYTQLRDPVLRRTVTHSGDIIEAPKPDGASEFIDITVHGKKGIQQVLPEARYAIMSLISFRGGPFSLIDNIAGVMTRKNGMRGKVFEPRTVETAMRSTVNSTNTIPLVVDLQYNELIWLDTSTGTRHGGYSTGASRAVETVKAVYQELAHQFTVGELMQLWADAHQVATADTPATQTQAAELLALC